MMAKRDPTWQPKVEDWRQVFYEQNAWHVSGKVPVALAREVERPLARSLWGRLAEDTPHRFQLVLGPRRVGKTTSMYQTVRRLLREGVDKRRLWWLRLDHPLLMQMQLGQLVAAVLDASADKPAYVFLDELTYAPEWDLWLKTFYDENWPVRIAGTSSSTAALRHRKLESGVGRWEEQYLAPYLFKEYLDLMEVQIELPVRDGLFETLSACVQERVDVGNLADPRRRFLLTGGFPELLIEGKQSPADDETVLLQSQRTLRSDAVERAIYKDIPQAFGVDNPMLLERMLYTLAGQVTGILSPTNLCQNLEGMSQPTFDRYLAYLTQAFLVFTLPNYSGAEESRQRRGRKLYFVDGAVRNAALQRGLGPLRDPIEMGLLLENLVAGHFQALSQQTQVRLYHWRDSRDEVDLIYDHPTHPVAFEIGLSPRHSRDGLRALVRRFAKFERRCFIVAPDAEAILPGESPDGIGSLPLDLLLVAVSAQAEGALFTRLGVTLNSGGDAQTT